MINLVIFISIALAKVFYYYIYRTEAEVNARFTSEVLPLAVFPASLSELASKPWTILTAMFTHIGVWMTLANMLWLWSFGYIMQDLTGNRKIVPLYIYGGLAGVIAFLLVSNLLPATAGQPVLSMYYGGAASITAIGTVRETMSGALQGEYGDPVAAETSVLLYKNKISSIPPRNLAAIVVGLTNSANVTLTPETNRAAAEAAMEVLIDVAKTRIFSAARRNGIWKASPIMINTAAATAGTATMTPPT